MFIELDPGTDRAPLAKRGLDPAGPPTRCPTSTPTRSSPPSTTTRATTSSCSSTAPGAGLQPAAAATCATSSAASSPRTATSRASTAPVAERHRNLRRLVHSLRLTQRRARGQGRRPRRARRLLLEGLPHLRLRAAEPRPRGRRPARHAAADDRHARQGPALRASPAPDGRRPAPAAEGARPRQRAGRAASPRRRRRSSASRSGPFVRDARPVVRSLKAPATDLAGATPDLTSTFTVAQPPPQPRRLQPATGRQGPTVAGRDEGYLFWLAWLQHNGAVAVLDLRRQRPVPPGDARRHVQRPQGSSPARTRR